MCQVKIQCHFKSFALGIFGVHFTWLWVNVHPYHGWKLPSHQICLHGALHWRRCTMQWNVFHLEMEYWIEYSSMCYSQVVFVPILCSTKPIVLLLHGEYFITNYSFLSYDITYCHSHCSSERFHFQHWYIGRRSHSFSMTKQHKHALLLPRAGWE